MKIYENDSAQVRIHIKLANHQLQKLKFCPDRLVGVVVKDIGAAGLGFDSTSVRSDSESRLRLSTVAMFLRSCVAKVLSRGDGSHHSIEPALESGFCCNSLRDLG